MKILVAQINPIIGDLKGNTERIIQFIEKGKNQRVDLVVFPEMALTGYPPEDFLLLPHFMKEVVKKEEAIVQATKGIAVIVGLPRENKGQTGKPLFNSAAFINDRKLIDYADKILLPTYDVFDEKRYFEPGEKVKIWTLKEKQIAVLICEDLWEHSALLKHPHYHRDPVLEIKEKPLSCLINISASPYSLNKVKRRLNVCLTAARTLHCPVILCNQVGGNDSLIFDGHSLSVDETGLLQQGKGFEEEAMVITLQESQRAIPANKNSIEEESELIQALVLGLRDYFKKLGFKKACSICLLFYGTWN